MSQKIFLSVFFGFIAGVFVNSFYLLNLSSIGLFVLLSIAAIFLSLINSKTRAHFLLISLVFISFSIGSFRFYTKDQSEQKHVLDNFVGEDVRVTGFIKEEVERRETSQRIILEGENLNFQNHDYPTSSKILVSTELFPTFSYGDRIVVTGEIEKPENFTTDIGKVFDYESYLKKDSIFYTMSFAHVEKIGAGGGSRVKSGILSIKNKFLESIGNVIPAPESSLLSGLLLGVKESLGEKLHQAFIDTGLVHIIVLSGYNVTIIAEAVIKTLSFLSVTAGIYVGGVFILIFAVMTGAGATIIRASIMALLALLARATGRNYQITRALLLAAMIMVMHNPYILVFDISFQLSFLATLGLIYFSPLLERFFRFMPTFAGLREITVATIGVQIFVLPFLLYKIGNFSLVAPITNLLVLPLIPATMFYGFVAGLVGLLSNILAAPFGFVSYLLLKFEIFIVILFAKLPFANFTFQKFPFILVLVCYAFLIWRMRKYYGKRK